MHVLCWVTKNLDVFELISFCGIIYLNLFGLDFWMSINCNIYMLFLFFMIFRKIFYVAILVIFVVIFYM